MKTKSIYGVTVTRCSEGEVVLSQTRGAERHDVVLMPDELELVIGWMREAQAENEETLS